MWFGILETTLHLRCSLIQVYLIRIGKKMNQIIQEFEDEQSELNEDSEFIEEDKEIDPNYDFDLT